MPEKKDEDKMSNAHLTFIASMGARFPAPRVVPQYKKPTGIRKRPKKTRLKAKKNSRQRRKNKR